MSHDHCLRTCTALFIFYPWHWIDLVLHDLTAAPQSIHGSLQRYTPLPLRGTKTLFLLSRSHAAKYTVRCSDVCAGVCMACSMGRLCFAERSVITAAGVLSAMELFTYAFVLLTKMIGLKTCIHAAGVVLRYCRWLYHDLVHYA